MKNIKKFSGAITALTAVVVTRVVLQSIGVEKIPLSVQLIIIILSPLILGIAFIKFSNSRNISKHLISALLIFIIIAIIISIMIILKGGYPQYFDPLRIPMVILIVVLLFLMVIVLIMGLESNSRK